MSSHTSTILLVPALFAALLAGMHSAFAAVMAVGATIEVSAQVVASCDIDTGADAVRAARVSVSCGGVAAPRVVDVPAAELSHPTAEEAASPAGTNAVLVTY